MIGSMRGPKPDGPVGEAYGRRLAEGGVTDNARTLGINRSTLYYRLRKHGLEHLLPTNVTVGDEPAGEPPA